MKLKIVGIKHVTDEKKKETKDYFVFTAEKYGNDEDEDSIESLVIKSSIELFSKDEIIEVTSVQKQATL